jgi:hypothetical protein
MKGYCDTCDHPRPRNLYYDDDIGCWRCTQCTERKQRQYEKDMKQDYEVRMYHERTHERSIGG